MSDCPGIGAKDLLICKYCSWWTPSKTGEVCVKCGNVFGETPTRKLLDELQFLAEEGCTGDHDDHPADTCSTDEQCYCDCPQHVASRAYDRIVAISLEAKREQNRLKAERFSLRLDIEGRMRTEAVQIERADAARAKAFQEVLGVCRLLFDNAIERGGPGSDAGMAALIIAEVERLAGQRPEWSK